MAVESDMQSKYCHDGVHCLVIPVQNKIEHTKNKLSFVNIIHLLQFIELITHS